MKTTTLGFIGGGRITRIILQALKNKAVEFESIIVFEPNTETSSELQRQFPEIKVADSPDKPAGQDLVFLAVHPPVMMEALGNIKETVTDSTVIVSLAPKITLERMASMLSKGKHVRMIPNATSIINKGYNPVSFSASISNDEKTSLLDLLKVLGKTFEVKESSLEGYAIVSAMLPTYFWFQWMKMEEIAIQTGIPEADINRIIGSTLRRSLKLFYKSNMTHEEVIDLIPVKPIGDNEEEIERILETKLLGLYEKIRPQ
ncbi:MAG: NAD(P)-binding domain-containing protein [Bacteroidales bacterium]|nr:MAG: NAD(P)-binding domain-containing protein [Bacteroidales bacterium]